MDSASWTLFLFKDSVFRSSEMLSCIHLVHFKPVWMARFFSVQCIMVIINVIYVISSVIKIVFGSLYKALW